MGEPFKAIGFRVFDEASYQALAREAHDRGIDLGRRREGRGGHVHHDLRRTHRLRGDRQTSVGG